MKIIVLVKEVPDTYRDRHIRLETGLVDRDASERVLDEIGERAVEAALTLSAEAPGSTVTAVIMGPVSALGSVRKALAMGADNALHVLDDGLLGADLTLTSEVLAAAVKRCDPDLVLLGNISTDGGGGVLGSMLAEHLRMPQATYLTSIAVKDGEVRGTRATDAGVSEITAPLPAVASITEALPDPRFPTLKGIMAAKKKPIETLTATDLGADVLGERSARSIVITAAARPPRAVGAKVVDEGDGGVQLAAYLTTRKLV